MDEEGIEESFVLEEEEGGKDVSVGEASWLHGKAQMLDEVNQLVELMTVEKSKLQENILALQSEVDEYHKQTEEHRQSSGRKEETASRLELEHSLLKEKNSQQQTLLHKTLRKTRRELRSVQQQVESITQSLAAERQCHLGVKSKLKSSEKSNRDLLQELCQQQTENKKLQDLLQEARQQTTDSQSQHQTLEKQLKNTREKEKKSREDILALRGRLARSQRAHTQLQTHCSVLEKGVETQVQQLATVRCRRSKEEMKLVQECRKKDELLGTYLHKISGSQEEQEILKKKMRELKIKLCSEEKQRKELNLKIEEREQRCIELQKQLEDSSQKRKQEEERAGVEVYLLVEKVRRLTRELESSQEELYTLRPEVVRLREREESCSVLVKRKQEEVESLRRQLEVTWADHQSSLKQSEARWAARLCDARSEYQRLKEVSTRRCAQLAREVWELKESITNQPQFNHP